MTGICTPKPAEYEYFHFTSPNQLEELNAWLCGRALVERDDNWYRLVNLDTVNMYVEMYDKVLKGKSDISYIGLLHTYFVKKDGCIYIYLPEQFHSIYDTIQS